MWWGFSGLESLTHDESLQRATPRLCPRRTGLFLFLGRGIHIPIALEWRPKLKESLHPCRGYPAGEMKHGPNDVDDDAAVVIIAELAM